MLSIFFVTFLAIFPIHTQIFHQRTVVDIVTPEKKLFAAIPTIAPTLTPTPIPTKIVVPTTAPSVISTPIVQQLSAGEYESYFNQYSSQYGVDSNLLKKIAKCESGINPGAVNGIYGGMFQFAPQTWIGTRNQMGLDPNPDLRFGAREAIETAAFKISKGGASAWAACL
ncbi:MAG TPA: transglycosylase family protein [Candidatus Nitrosocosmicus sp.]|nr:transglycosylase family protein [Candidatus Nitrosocosmicus sp.]